MAVLSTYVPYPAAKLVEDNGFRLAILRLLGQGGALPSVLWGNVNGTPTTLAGYGITDALSASNITTASTEIAYGVGSNTIDGSADFTWNATGKVLSVGDTTPVGYFNVRPLAAGTTSLGPELLDGAGWVQTGWTGNFATGFTHTTGNTSVLSRPTPLSMTDTYLVSVIVTNRTAGNVTVTLGSLTVTATANGTFTVSGISTSAITQITATPGSTFNGTVVLSVKKIVPATPVVVLKDSSGASSLEIRTTTVVGNTFVGLNSGSVATGTSNTFFGANTGAQNYSGTDNVAVGYNAFLNSKSSFNVAIGSQALAANTTTSATGNVAIGYQAATSSTATNNVVIGYQAGSVGINFAGNVFVGYQAGQNANFVNNGVLIGFSAGKTMSSSTYPIFIGPNAGDTTAGASYPIGIGYEALKNITGSNNIGIGYQAGRSATSASGATIIGQTAAANATGIGNSVIIGYGAAVTNAGTNSVYIGYNSSGTIGASSEIVIGFGATGRGSNTTTIGYSGQQDALIYGSLSTSSPGGAGQGKWKLGKKVDAAATVDTTKYIELMVDGVLYKLALIV